MDTIAQAYAMLMVTIVLEVAATSALVQSDGFSNRKAAMWALGGYAASYALLAFPLSILNVGVAYALWVGFGIALFSIVNWLVFHQRLDGPALTGMAFITAGVMVMTIFSETLSH